MDNYSNRIVIMHTNIYRYPDKSTNFRPGIRYPEYLFGEDICHDGNNVYDMVREGFRMMKLDVDNYGLSSWNPLGKYIKPKDKVLIKPNFVFHTNDSGNGMDCMVTNPSVIAAVLDYVLIALRGEGSVLIGDAPIQSCKFDELIKRTGMDVLILYYRTKGIDVSISDFRKVKTDRIGNILYNQKATSPAADPNSSITVKLTDGESSFGEISGDKLQRMRVTDYDYHIMNQHNQEGIHEYIVDKNVLEADVIINMPKPKTHRFGGVTSALKNMIGINSNKECLPHHTKGSIAEGGDCYEIKSKNMQDAYKHCDQLNTYLHEEKIDEASGEAIAFKNSLDKGLFADGEKYWNGGWYKNDTIWRTIADLNKIVYFADKTGKMCSSAQRKIFIVGDMIIGGDHSGPLSPSPVDAGIIAMGEDPLLFDRAVCSVMGFDYNKIPQLNKKNEKYFGDIHYEDADKGNGRHAGIQIMEADSISGRSNDITIISNDNRWNGKGYDILKNNSVHYTACYGWEPVLGYADYSELKKEICEAGGSVAVFGFGQTGKFQALTLMRWGFKVKCFFDNDSKKWNETFMGITCRKPENIANQNISACIVSIKGEKAIQEVLEQIRNIGFKNVFVFNDMTEA